MRNQRVKNTRLSPHITCKHYFRNTFSPGQCVFYHVSKATNVPHPNVSKTVRQTDLLPCGPERVVEPGLPKDASLINKGGEVPMMLFKETLG